MTILTHSRRFLSLLLGSLLSATAATATSEELIIANAPLFVIPGVPPMVMLSMSNDHQLFFQAFPEYADLDKDGAANRTYTHSFDYYGYFDSYKCYDYGNGLFYPADGTDDKYCGSGRWSGNFLNWVSMARIDVIRKILYGGYRSTDTSSDTVLERTYLPNDAHSWVKYYDGADISRLTPFDLPTATQTTSADSRSIPDANRTESAARRTFTTGWTQTAQVQVGDQVLVTSRGLSSAWMRGVVIAFNPTTKVVEIQVTNSSQVGTTRSDWDITNPSRRGASFCNTTVSSTTWSQDVTDPPLVRAAQGDYRLWAANERWQCRWSEEKSRTGHPQMTIGSFQFSNGNDAAITRIASNSDNPVRDQFGLGEKNYIVRVKACSQGNSGSEDCKVYPSGGLKPIGLLQEYGDEDKILFGLLTGSYMRNKSGGVLRKNIASISDEVNVETDGTFKAPPSGGNIIGVLDRLRPYGYSHSNGFYNSSGPGGDNCPWALNTFSDGRCSNWGNPQSEIFLESLRYLAGADPSASFSVSGIDRISGLPSLTAWKDPLNSTNWCSVLSVINFNSSSSSYDTDQLDGASDISSSTANALTDILGEAENMNGGSWFIGESGTSNDQLCTGKEVESLSAAKGVCPESPRLEGGYQIAGLAHHAYTSSIRKDLQDNTGQLADIQVKTYGVSLAPAVPRITIPKPGAAETAVTLLPACRNDTVKGNCSIVDFKVLFQNIEAGTGAFLVQWEDSEQGGDYDMDMNGIIEYIITETEIRVTTRIVSQSTPDKMGFGYVISGTELEGFFAPSGINGFTYAPGGGGPACNACAYNDPASPHDFPLGKSGTGSLENPLFYAAKWGGYSKELQFPDDPKSWDQSGDGVPDNYFYAIDPKDLSAGLQAALEDSLGRSEESASSAAASTAILQSDTLLYTAGFRSDDWSGTLIARRINTEDGVPLPLSPGNGWDAEKVLANTSPEQRKIFTFAISDNGDTSPLELRRENLSDLGPKQVGALNHPLTGSDPDYMGEARIDWLRGNDGAAAVFRKRTSEDGDLEDGDLEDGDLRLIGDIVNSNPQFRGRFYNGSSRLLGAPSYRVRPDVLYVGANDGMLHAFKAETGEELFAFVPGSLLLPEQGLSFSKLNRLMDPSYAHRFYVDGTPEIEEASIGGEWRTVLVGTLGSGGRSVFALDVTDPENFTKEDVLWEFTDPDLGYNVGQPAVARLRTSNNTFEWVALFGNGYNGDNHRAMLYIVRLSDGGLIDKLDTGVGDESLPNGLGSPKWTHWPANDLIANRVYAGDIRGNLWRFDVSNHASRTSSLLFRAQDADAEGNPQPITARPVVSSAPDGSNSVIVAFGTGSYFRSPDATDQQVQTLYGIRDVDNVSAEDPPVVRSELQRQEIEAEVSVSSGGVTKKVRRVSANAFLPDTESELSPGWYLDLKWQDELGERVISEATFPSGPARKRIRFTTLIPDKDPCSGGRRGNLYDLDLLSGGRSVGPVFDLNRDGAFDEYDTLDGVPPSAISFGSGERLTVINVPGKNIEYGYSGTGSEVVPLEGGGGLSGRQSWQQLR